MNQPQQKSSKKTFIALIIIIVIAVLIYFYTMGNPTDNSSLVQTTAVAGSEDAQRVGTRVLTLLNQINSLKIDASIFTSATYKSLVDYTITIPEQPVGRPNPFAPLPGSVSATTKTTGVIR